MAVQVLVQRLQLAILIIDQALDSWNPLLEGRGIWFIGPGGRHAGRQQKAKNDDGHSGREPLPTESLGHDSGSSLRSRVMLGPALRPGPNITCEKRRQRPARLWA